MTPERMYWGPYCVWPREPGPYVHEIYPVGFGSVADEGVIRPLTVGELDEMNEVLADGFRRTFIEESRLTSNTAWYLPKHFDGFDEE